jgi:hypothetical protein
MSAVSADIAGTENTPRAVATAAATSVWRARPTRPSVEGCKGKRIGVIVDFPVVLLKNAFVAQTLQPAAKAALRLRNGQNSRKRLAPHTLLQLCDGGNAETLQFYFSARRPVVVFLHKRAVVCRILRSFASVLPAALRFGRILVERRRPVIFLNEI